MATRPLPLNRLLERLDSEWHLTRQGAIRQAEALPCDALERLLQMAADRGQRKKRRSELRFGFLFVCTVFVYAILRVSHLSLEAAAAVTVCFAFFGWLLILLPLAVMGMEQQAYPAVLDICAATRDPRFLGPTLNRARMLRHAPPEESGPALQTRLARLQATAASLTMMLQSISSDNAPALTLEQHAHLLTLLGQEHVEFGYTLAALQALPHIGQESALPRLTALAHDGDLPLRVRDAIEVCRVQLEARLALSRQAGSLLRASSLSDIAGKSSLLRAASAHSETTDTEQLLRPTIAEK